MVIFKSGQVVATPGALELVSNNEITKALDRHFSGDWGDLCEEDKTVNDEAVISGDRILSAYHTEAGDKFWIITEWDRSVTTVLLPEEY